MKVKKYEKRTWVNQYLISMHVLNVCAFDCVLNLIKINTRPTPIYRFAMQCTLPDFKARHRRSSKHLSRVVSHNTFLPSLCVPVCVCVCVHLTSDMSLLITFEWCEFKMKIFVIVHIMMIIKWKQLMRVLCDDDRQYIWINNEIDDIHPHICESMWPRRHQLTWEYKKK